MSLPRPARRREMRLVGLLLVIALLLRVNVRQGSVRGASMEPTYSNGDTVLVWKTVPRARLRPRDIVVVRDTNGDELIKRIAFIRPRWEPAPPSGFYVLPNGGRLIPYSLLFGDYFRRVADGRLPRPPAQNTIYLLGDNLPLSDDSRHIGPVSPTQVLGKVVP